MRRKGTQSCGQTMESLTRKSRKKGRGRGSRTGEWGAAREKEE